MRKLNKDVLTFYCDFGNGGTCTITFNLADFRRDPRRIRPQTKWVGERRNEMFDTYRNWIHTVNARISEALQGPHAYVLQHWAQSPHWEHWVYFPDGEMRLIAEGDGKVDSSRIG